MLDYKDTEQYELSVKWNTHDVLKTIKIVWPVRSPHCYGVRVSSVAL